MILDINPTIVIGCGNNGTRVAAWYLLAFGIHILVDVYDTMDWLPAQKFIMHWLWQNLDNETLDWQEIERDFREEVLSKVGSTSAMNDALRNIKPKGHLLVVLPDRNHTPEKSENGVDPMREKIFESPWGFKVARGVAMLNILHGLMPQMKVVHVMRDARSVSGPFKERWANRIFEKVIPEEMKDLDERYLWLWSKFNTMCADYGEAEMGDNYISVRLEDLALKKEESIERLSKFLGMELIEKEIIDEILEQQVRDRLVDKSVECDDEALKRFGYI